MSNMYEFNNQLDPRILQERELSGIRIGEYREKEFIHADGEASRLLMKERLKTEMTTEMVEISPGYLAIQKRQDFYKVKVAQAIVCWGTVLQVYEGLRGKEPIYVIKIRTEAGKRESVLPPIKKVIFDNPKKLYDFVGNFMEFRENGADRNSVMRLFWQFCKNRILKDKFVRLPDTSGWFRAERWNYVVETDVMRIDTVVNEKNVEDFENERKASEVVNRFLKEFKKIPDLRSSGVLLFYHLTAFLGEFLNYCLPERALLLIGEGSISNSIANKYLKVIPGETLDLTAEKPQRLEEKIYKMKDDVAVCKILAGSAYGLQIINSLIERQVSQEDSVCLKAPIALCSNQVDFRLELEHLLVLSFNDIYFEFTNNTTVLDDFCKLLINWISESGDYWPERIAVLFNEERVNTLWEPNGKSKCIYKTLQRFFREMFALKNVPDLLSAEFLEILKAGERAFCESGEMSDPDYLCEIFIEGVKRMAEQSEIQFSPVSSSEIAGKNVIYYDNNYYYFQQNVLENVILEKLGLAAGLLPIKRILYEKKVLKTSNLQSNGYKMIFRVGTMKVRGYIIRRSLFEQVGGVCLWERGR